MPKSNFKISCEAQNNIAVIRIDGRISEWRYSASNFKSQVDALVANGIKDATVYINTPGGDCFEANEIGNEIIKFTGTLKAELGAICASAGTYIASLCSHVSAARNISYMIHKPMGGIEGNSDEVKAQLKLLENMEAEYARTYSEKTGLPIAKIQAMWVEDYWMNAEEAKKLGFIQEIIGEAPITNEFIETIKACGYKNMPAITATAKITDTTKNEKLMKQIFITALALAADITDAQLIAHLEGLKVKAASADALKTELENLKKTAAEDKAEAVLTAAIKEKKILATQKDFYKKNLLADFEGTKTMLDAIPAVTALSAEITKGATGSTEDRSAWTYADYQEKNPKALAELADTDEAKFKALFKAHYGKDC